MLFLAAPVASTGIISVIGYFVGFVANYILKKGWRVYLIPFLIAFAMGLVANIFSFFLDIVDISKAYLINFLYMFNPDNVSSVISSGGHDASLFNCFKGTIAYFGIFEALENFVTVLIGALAIVIRIYFFLFSMVIVSQAIQIYNMVLIK